MGIDYRVDVGYGFFFEGESVWDLPRRLGRADYEIDGLLETELLKSLGYSGLQIISKESNGDDGGWAICAEESHMSVDPKYESGSWPIGGERISDEAMASLIVARDTLFPLVEGKTVIRPRIGWFLLSSIW